MTIGLERQDMTRITLLLLSFVFLSACGGGGGGGGTAVAQESGPLVLAMKSASGTVMGRLIDAPAFGQGTNRVFTTISNSLTVMSVGGNPPQMVQQVGGIYFLTADCTGVPYVEYQQSIVDRLIGSYNGLWYVAPWNAVPQDINYFSQGYSGGCDVTGGAGGSATVVSPIVLSASQSQVINGFVAPFEAALVAESSLPGI